MAGEGGRWVHAYQVRGPYSFSPSFPFLFLWLVVYCGWGGPGVWWVKASLSLSAWWLAGDA